MSPNEPGKGEIVRIGVIGKDEKLWAKLYPTLVGKVQNLLDSTLDHNKGSTVRDELKDFTSELLDFAKAKLATPGLEAQKIAAEITQKYAEHQTELAQADKTREEARERRIKNDIRELRYSLTLTKALVMADDDESAIFFGKQIDSFLELLKDLGQTL